MGGASTAEAALTDTSPAATPAVSCKTWRRDVDDGFATGSLPIQKKDGIVGARFAPVTRLSQGYRNKSGTCLRDVIAALELLL